MKIDAGHSFVNYHSLKRSEHYHDNKPISKTDNQNDQEKKHKKEETPEVRDKVIELKRNEQKVKAHEMAHQIAGGNFAGGVSYKTTVGPDGKNYIVGGEVPISAPEGKTPEETVQNMEQVIKAAMAPQDPSPQDYAVASKASMLKIKAQQEAYKKTLEMEEQLQKDPKNINPTESTEFSKDIQIQLYA